MRSIFFLVATGGLASALTAYCAEARAAACSSLTNPIYIESGDTQLPMLEKLGRYLRDESSPITLVFYKNPTCTLAADLYAATPNPNNFSYMPSQEELPDCTAGETTGCYNAASPTLESCTPDTGSTGIVADLGIGATFISSCTTLPAQPANITRSYGPAQGYGFVVPAGVVNTVPGISREQAYFVFSGQGAADNVVPWIAVTSPTTPFLFVRGATASTALTIAANIAPTLLSSAQLGTYAKTESTSTAIVTDLVAGGATSTPSEYLGILGLDVYESNRGSINVLAYRAQDQLYAYYPDSTISSHDKKNVRDGHYLPWSYTEYIFNTSAPHYAAAQTLFAYVAAASPQTLTASGGQYADTDSISIIAPTGLIPWCAMQVTRPSDGADLSLYSDPVPCECFYEATVATTTCAACSATNPCSVGTCRRGYCEAH